MGIRKEASSNEGHYSVSLTTNIYLLDPSPRLQQSEVVVVIVLLNHVSILTPPRSMEEASGCQCFNSASGCIILHSQSVDSDFPSFDMTREEVGCGSFQLFTGDYPILNFCLPKTGNDALQMSVQLVRKIIRRPVLERENITCSKIVISTIGFVFGLVGLLRNPSSLPAGVKAIFIAGVVHPSFPSCQYRHFNHQFLHRRHYRTHQSSSLSQSSIGYRLIMYVDINMVATLFSFVWRWMLADPFIYWAPAAMKLDCNINICGIRIVNPIPILAMTGVVLGIRENAISCG